MVFGKGMMTDFFYAKGKTEFIRELLMMFKMVGMVTGSEVSRMFQDIRS